MLPYAQILPGVGPSETLLIVVLGVLLFGKKLPEVGRSIGKGIVEFKKGLRGIEDEIDLERRPTGLKPVSKVHSPRPSDTFDVDAPKFVPPTSPPSTATSGLTEYESSPYSD
jgi:sec-independent protein translocase protein TatA